MTANDDPHVERISARGIAYRVLGSSRPIVLLHGWCLDRRIWMYPEEALAATPPAGPGTSFCSPAPPVAPALLAFSAALERVALAAWVPTPTLFTPGADGHIVPPRVSQECAARMRAATVELVANSGHLAVLD